MLLYATPPPCGILDSLMNNWILSADIHSIYGQTIEIIVQQFDLSSMVVCISKDWTLCSIISIFFVFLSRLHFSITRSVILLGFAFHLDFSLHSILIHLKDNGFYQYCVYSCLHFLCISLILHVLTIFVNACEVLPPPLLCLCLFCYCQLQLVDLWHIEIGYLFNNNKNKNRASTDIGKSLESHVLVFTLYQFHSFNYWGRSIIDSLKGQIERSAIKCWGEEVH